MVSIFVPALNEQKNLEATVDTILAAAQEADNTPVEIIIVNDGSTDGTQGVIEGLQKKHSFIRSIRHEKNRGLGAGFREALAEARHEKFLLVPGDNDLSAEALKSLFLKSRLADMVFIFFLNNEIRGRFRHTVSLVFGLIYTVTFGVFVQYINSPSVYLTAKLRTLNIRSERFSIFSEINTKMLCLGSTFCEVYDYRRNGNEGSTSMSFKNFVEIVTTYFKLVYEIRFTNRRQFGQKPVRVAA